jgi:hypothetical protein
MLTLTRVRASIAAVEKQWVLHNCLCICSLRYPACNMHAPYCHQWPAPLYNIFPHSLFNGTIFGKKLLNIKYLFWFSLQLLPQALLILRKIYRDIKNVYSSSRKVGYPLFLSDFNYFRKIIKYKISWKSILWETSCPMDRQEASCRCSQFCERA